MSSTTSRRGERGQILAIFAFGLIAMLAIAALVFDVGQNLFDRRRHQDAADASALAGARYLTVPACKVASTKAACPEAAAAALEIAVQHGYDTSQVMIKIPPDATTQLAGVRGHIQVTIESNRGSFFAGVIGMASSRVAALAVAGNDDHYPVPFSFLALDPHTCKSGHIHGSAVTSIQGNVEVASDCDQPGSLVFDGNSSTVSISGTCSTPGGIDIGPSATVGCAGGTAEGPSVPPVTDPLSGLGAPAIGTSKVPKPPQTPMTVSGSVKLDGCPGAAGAATEAAPSKGCEINGVGVAGGSVRIYPGVYWGGITLAPNKPLTVYMEPGIYYLAGGGLEVSGSNIRLSSVVAGTTTAGGGVLIYNNDAPSWHAKCLVGGAPAGACIDAMDFQNTLAGAIELYPYEGPLYTNMLMIQDRAASKQPPFKLTGNANSGLHGTIYLPKANFEFAGNGVSAFLNAQIIAWQFDVGGNGDLTVTYIPDEAVQLQGVGLVQ